MRFLDHPHSPAAPFWGFTSLGILAAAFTVLFGAEALAAQASVPILAAHGFHTLWLLGLLAAFVLGAGARSLLRQGGCDGTFDALPDPVFILSRDGRVLQANEIARDLLPATPKNMPFELPLLLDPRARSTFREILQRCLENERTYSFPIHLASTADGVGASYQVSLKPFGGKLQGRVVASLHERCG